MERLTRKSTITGKWMAAYGPQKITDHLAAYEDTGLTPEQIVEKETTLNGTYISMEAHNREVKKLKAEIGYEQDRIDCRNAICNENRKGMYARYAQLEEMLAASRHREKAAVEFINWVHSEFGRYMPAVYYDKFDKWRGPQGSGKGIEQNG